MNKEILTVYEYNKLVHEVKNPLTICRGYLEMIKKDGVCSNYLDIIMRELNRSIMLLTDYMVIDNKKINLYELLEDITNIINPYFNKNNSKIIVNCRNKNIELIGDYNKLKQIIINLIKNAYEAKGLDKLIVVVDVISVKLGYIIKIIDNGIGMDEKTLDKFKNKYYTTKDEGSGIGVSVVLDNIKEYGGSIHYYSKEDIGTRVEIYIPKKSPKTFNNNNCY